MADQFTVPEGFEVSFRRILPYLAAPLQKKSQILNSLSLYLKLGGEKMARIAIDAMNVTQRLEDAELKKQLREQELLNDEHQDDLDDDDIEDDDDKNEKEGDAGIEDDDALEDDDED
jgi:hypothetical protein